MGFLSTLKFYAKSVAFGGLIAACALYGVFASVILRVVGKPEYAQYTVARAFYYSFSKLLNIRIVLKNEQYLHKKPAIVISNHQSALDILVLGRIFMPGFTVTAKKALQYVPFLGWFMLASGTFFLDRAKGEKAKKVLDNALLGLKQKERSIFMFPEGTRSATKKLEMLPFKKGAFHLAKQARIPIIPVAVGNYSTIFSSRDKIFKTGEIVIEVLPPISMDDVNTKEEVTAVAEKARNQMLEKIEAFGYALVDGEKKPEPTSDEIELPDDASVEIVSELTPLVSAD